jgi:hypothetical protein
MSKKQAQNNYCTTLLAVAISKTILAHLFRFSIYPRLSLAPAGAIKMLEHVDRSQVEVPPTFSHFDYATYTSSPYVSGNIGFYVMGPSQAKSKTGVSQLFRLTAVT